MRLHNLTKWSKIPQGESVRFASPKPRTVTLDVNTPYECLLWIEQFPADLDPELITDMEAGRTTHGTDVTNENGEQFLARVRGRDQIEFAVQGEFIIRVEGSDAWIYSTDGQDTFTRIPVPVVFTKIALRKDRNRHLEMIEFTAKQNMRRMEAAMKTELERRSAAFEAKMEQYVERRVKPPAIPVETSSPSQPGDGTLGAATADGQETGGGATAPVKRKTVAAPPVDGSKTEKA